MNSKIDRQLQLEEMMLGLGRARYFNQVTGESDTAPGKHLLRGTVEPLAEAISAYVENALGGRAGRRAVAAKYLAEVDAEVVAALTSKVCINRMTERGPILTTAMQVAGALEQHVSFTEFMQNDPGLWKVVQRKLASCTHGRHRAAVIRRYMGVTSVTGLGWTQPDKALVGMRLVELFIDSTGLARKVLRREGKRKINIFEPTDKVDAWLSDQHEHQSWLSPLYLPMVVPPDNWTNPLDGGYLTKGLSRVSLVKVRRKETIDELFNTDMPEVYDAVNALQRTPWRVNRAIYRVLKQLVNEGSSLANLPSDQPLPFPPRPPGIPEDVPLGDLPKDQQEALRIWKGDTAAMHTENAKRLSKRVALCQQLWVSSEYVDEEELYFPYSLDFRGRIYPVPGVLHPQADDTGRALLEFAKGKPLGPYGAGWLAVHLANLFGYDKVSFADRVEWVNEHSEKLLDSAMNPLDGGRFWTEADKPWCALAACFEYAGYMLEGEAYVSHLPIAMDGTCSGLQHFSALLRDPVGARAVNLIQPDDGQKADIYQAVADAVELRLNASDLADDPFARAWKGKVTRKIVKRPCMTYAYSVSPFGITKQILDEVTKLDAAGDEWLPGVSNFDASRFLTQHVLTAIRQTVDAAATAMDWLQRAIRVASEAGPVVWTAPTGLPVWQDERTQRGHQVEMIFQGKRIRVNLSFDTPKMDKVAQKNGVAPNFVHSLDAAHLIRTVNGCVDRGLADFSMIHDSFGVHACDVDTLHYVLRQEFVRLYEVNRLEELQEQLAASLPADLAADLPPVPEQGDLDLERVRESDFFFS